MTALHHFRHKMPVAIRYADIDMMNHVNNVTYLTYLEQARIEYAKDVLSWDGRMETLNIIVAHQRYDYIMPVFLFDKVEVWTRVAKMGNKSFDLEYLVVRLTKGDPEPVGHGLTTMVTYDFAQNKSYPIPAEWREAVQTYEPLIPQL